MQQQLMNVLALVKDTDRYVFIYDDESEATLLQLMGRYASDKSLSFTWYDAAVLSQKIRRLREIRSRRMQQAKDQ